MSNHAKPKMVFVQQLKVEMIGTMLLSALLKEAGYDCELFLGAGEHDWLRQLKSMQPDLIGFSTRTGQHMWCLNIARQIKDAMDVPIVFGGPHATVCPEIVEHDQVDYVVVGEAETAIVELMAAVTGCRTLADVSNLVYKIGDGQVQHNPLAPPVMNLDAVPLPDREFAYAHKVLRDSPTKSFIGGRGCPHGCTFCHHFYERKLYKGHNLIRRMSPERLIEDVKSVKDKYPLEFVSYDNYDYFLQDPEWAETVLRLHAQQIKLPYLIETRAESLTPEIVELLKDTGCVGVAFSLESADEHLRNDVLKKHIKIEDVRRAAALIRAAGIPLRIYFMLGIPGETFDTAMKTLQEAIELEPDFAHCTLATPYPKTGLLEIAKEMNLLPEDFSFDKLPYGYQQRSVLRLPDIERIEKLQKLFILTTRHKMLAPAVRKLCSLPDNPLFMCIGIGSYVYYGSRFYRMKNKDLIKLVISNLGYGLSLLSGSKSNPNQS